MKKTKTKCKIKYNLLKKDSTEVRVQGCTLSLKCLSFTGPERATPQGPPKAEQKQIQVTELLMLKELVVSAVDTCKSRSSYKIPCIRFFIVKDGVKGQYTPYNPYSAPNLASFPQSWLLFPPSNSPMQGAHCCPYLINILPVCTSSTPDSYTP